MTDTLTTEDSYAAKIAKLLARAEHPNTPEPEADACLAKAQELMLTYAIDQDLIDRARGKERSDKLGSKVLRFDGTFRMATMRIGWSLAQQNNLRGFKSEHVQRWEREKDEPQHIKLHLFGFESDLERVELLNASLQIQCATALSRWWKEAKITPRYAHLSGSDQSKVRRQFIFSFADGVFSRLAAANAAAAAEAAKHQAERTGDSAADSEKSVALVLVDRKQQVNEWYDKTHGKSTRKAKSNFRGGGHDAASAGRRAGQNADLGGTAVGQRKAIG